MKKAVFVVFTLLSVGVLNGCSKNDDDRLGIEGSWVYSTANCAGSVSLEGLYEIVIQPSLAVDAVNAIRTDSDAFTFLPFEGEIDPYRLALSDCGMTIPADAPLYKVSYGTDLGWRFEGLYVDGLNVIVRDEAMMSLLLPLEEFQKRWKAQSDNAS